MVHQMGPRASQVPPLSIEAFAGSLVCNAGLEAEKGCSISVLYGVAVVSAFGLLSQAWTFAPSQHPDLIVKHTNQTPGDAGGNASQVQDRRSLCRYCQDPNLGLAGFSLVGTNRPAWSWGSVVPGLPRGDG